MISINIGAQNEKRKFNLWNNNIFLDNHPKVQWIFHMKIVFSFSFGEFPATERRRKKSELKIIYRFLQYEWKFVLDKGLVWKWRLTSKQNMIQEARVSIFWNTARESLRISLFEIKESSESPRLRSETWKRRPAFPLFVIDQLFQLFFIRVFKSFSRSFAKEMIAHALFSIWKENLDKKEMWRHETSSSCFFVFANSFGKSANFDIMWRKKFHKSYKLRTIFLSHCRPRRKRGHRIRVKREKNAGKWLLWHEKWHTRIGSIGGRLQCYFQQRLSRKLQYSMFSDDFQFNVQK